MNNAILFNELKSHHDKFLKKHKTLESFFHEMEFYESFIPKFFSKNGEADNIKNMYENIQYDLADHCEKHIDCIDANRCYDVYTEYMNGMKEFMNNILTCDENNLKPFEEKMEIATSNDAAFISSLYKGNIENYAITEKPLSEAVSNIEFLIDFIPQLSVLKEHCEEMLNKIVDGNYDGEKEKLLIEGMDMMYSSIDEYCYGTLRTILEDYDKINDVLFKEDDNTPLVKETYVLL